MLLVKLAAGEKELVENQGSQVLPAINDRLEELACCAHNWAAPRGPPMFPVKTPPVIKANLQFGGATEVGEAVGVAVGAGDGGVVGELEGARVGDPVGAAVGAAVGARDPDAPAIEAKSGVSTNSRASAVPASISAICIAGRDEGVVLFIKRRLLCLYCTTVMCVL